MGGFGLEDDDEDYVSPFEMAARRYIVLLLMSFSPDVRASDDAQLSYISLGRIEPYLFVVREARSSSPS